VSRGRRSASRGMRRRRASSPARSRRDLTAAMQALAAARVAGLARSISPATSSRRTPVLRHGAGAACTAARGRPRARRSARSPVSHEAPEPPARSRRRGGLHDPELRESFDRARVRLLALAALAGDAPTARRASSPSTPVHKLQLLAHHPAAYTRLGTARRRPPRTPLADVIRMRTARASWRPPACGRRRARHVNVLEHMLGYVTRAPRGRDERRELSDVHRRLPPRPRAARGTADAAASPRARQACPTSRARCTSTRIRGS
jgi:hypothetical protein